MQTYLVNKAQSTRNEKRRDEDVSSRSMDASSPVAQIILYAFYSSSGIKEGT